jgi:hypothetical protein
MGNTASTSIQSKNGKKNARSRESQFQKEKFFETVTRAADSAAKKYDVPINVDIDERGGYPRISITPLTDDDESEAGIKVQRRYP